MPRSGVTRAPSPCTAPVLVRCNRNDIEDGRCLFRSKSLGYRGWLHRQGVQLPELLPLNLPPLHRAPRRY